MRLSVEEWARQSSREPLPNGKTSELVLSFMGSSRHEHLAWRSALYHAAEIISGFVQF
jgi:hypothetical protein